MIKVCNLLTTNSHVYAYVCALYAAPLTIPDVLQVQQALRRFVAPTSAGGTAIVHQHELAEHSSQHLGAAFCMGASPELSPPVCLVAGDAGLTMFGPPQAVLGKPIAPLRNLQSGPVWDALPHLSKTVVFTKSLADITTVKWPTQRQLGLLISSGCPDKILDMLLCQVLSPLAKHSAYWQPALYFCQPSQCCWPSLQRWWRTELHKLTLNGLRVQVASGAPIPAIMCFSSTEEQLRLALRPAIGSIKNLMSAMHANDTQ